MRRPIDTSIEARERQLEAYRAMTPEHRLHIADRMSAEIRSLARSGICARRPGASDEEVDAALARILLGPALAAAAFARREAGRR